MNDYECMETEISTTSHTYTALFVLDILDIINK